MEVTINITFYHGTNLSNVPSILSNGFKDGTNSMGTTRLNWANGFGDCVLKFKMPYRIKLKYLPWLFNEWIIRRDLSTCLVGFKPKKVSIELNNWIYEKI